MYPYPPKSRPHSTGKFAVIALIVLALIGARSIASFFIEYQWWKEMGQVNTWFNMLTYEFAPVLGGTMLAFAVLWIAHARAMKFAGVSLREYRLYGYIVSLGLLALGYLIASASIDTWTVVRYAGAAPAEASAWRDPVFALPLKFYLFDLPFFSMLRSYLLALTILSVLVYWITARGWQLRYRLPDFRNTSELDINFIRLEGGLDSKFLRGAAAVFLLALALRFFLARYEMVWNWHEFMVGIDYVDQNIALPLQWLAIGACVAAALLVSAGRWVPAACMALVLPIQFGVPRLVAALYVRPNEISLERPYVQDHIKATRSAFGLDHQLREIEFKAQPNAPIDPVKHKSELENVRLWDWQAFHDTVAQIQALRPYYAFADTDVDRYMIDGQLRQVLLSPRELDIRQLPDAQSRWINPHFIYTHGYGLVMAEVSKIMPDGRPVMLIENAPPEVKTSSLKLTRPEIYYGEVVHEPVFVHTAQQEFNYPSGADNVLSNYQGKGGFPIHSFPIRLAAAIREGDPNIVLTSYLTENSRMMIRRKVTDRVKNLARFIQWDSDPYLVVTEDGKLVWMIDGYTVSNAHPYSASVNVQGAGPVNYIRNSVKATVDAYDGETNLYNFAPSDPIIQAYARLFPDLFRPASAMPADLRAHARYPETMFRIQAEIYRTFHMTDPQAFYNKEDIWHLARYSPSTNEPPKPVSPTYVVASLPGEEKTEFLLLTPFTPKNKDNLIGLMLARCDGENLGELVVLMLSKQELIFGPMQIAARINQDQTIAKDISLWNQQSSRVLRGQTLVLPAGNNFLYVDPIYIQATEARMPQLKKVVLAVGDRLIYADTYNEALSRLSDGAQQAIQEAEAPVVSQTTPVSQPDSRLQNVRNHLRRYREFAAQGKWAEAGKELEAIEAEVK